VLASPFCFSAGVPADTIFFNLFFLAPLKFSFSFSSSTLVFFFFLRNGARGFPANFFLFALGFSPPFKIGAILLTRVRILVSSLPLPSVCCSDTSPRRLYFHSQACAVLGFRPPQTGLIFAVLVFSFVWPRHRCFLFAEPRSLFVHRERRGLDLPRNFRSPAKLIFPHSCLIPSSQLDLPCDFVSSDDSDEIRLRVPLLCCPFCKDPERVWISSPDFFLGRFPPRSTRSRNLFSLFVCRTPSVRTFPCPLPRA